MYILLNGSPPFDGTEEEIFRILRKVNIKLSGDYWDYVSLDAKNLLKGLLEPDCTKRISAASACVHP